MRTVVGKFTRQDRIAHVLHKSVHEVEVVVRAEHEPQNFTLLVQMANITERILFAHLAAASTVDRIIRACMLEVTQVYFALRGEDLAVACIARR